MEIKSHAKINLFLYNLGKRADGYHDLYTLFYEINLYDTITLNRAKQNFLQTNNPFIPVNDSNIIMKVDKILREEHGLNIFYNINLTKRIPVGGGLGGGSSNAAAYVKAVNLDANLGLTIEQMHSILARVGSDSSFFLYAPVALGQGRGEILTPIKNFPKLYIVAITPNVSISTAHIFGSQKLRLTTDTNINIILDSITPQKLIDHMRNDLQDAVFSEYPEVAKACSDIEKAGAVKAIMSGAGSTVFGIFETEKEQQEAYLQLKKMHNQSLVLKL